MIFSCTAVDNGCALLQGHSYVDVFKRAFNSQGANKLGVILNGPGWEPGKPRLGLVEDIPEVRRYAYTIINAAFHC